MTPTLPDSKLFFPSPQATRSPAQTLQFFPPLPIASSSHSKPGPEERRSTEETENRALRIRIEKLTTERDDARGALRAYARDKSNNINRGQTVLRLELTKQREEKATATQKLKECEERLALLETENQTLNKAILKQTQAHTTLIEQIEQKDARLAQYCSKLADKDIENEALNKSILQQKEAHTALIEQIEQKDARLAQHCSQLASKDIEIHSQKRSFDEESNRLVAENVRLNELVKANETQICSLKEDSEKKMKDLNVENAELRKKLNARQIEVGYLDQLNVENAELREKLNAKQNEVQKLSAERANCNAMFTTNLATYQAALGTAKNEIESIANDCRQLRMAKDKLETRLAIKDTEIQKVISMYDAALRKKENEISELRDANSELIGKIN